MDDTLEIPRPRAQVAQEGDDQSSGDEDGGLDWTKLPTIGAAARPNIPKRGEKDFEPAHGGGSGLQLHVLDRSRDAMFETLRATRTISSKTISYGIWYPSIDRVHVTTARGIHFSTMGHSVSRTVWRDSANDDSPSKLLKRLELLPEEALYLIERGALFCYKTISAEAPLLDSSRHETQSPGTPMSVQQAFAEMIGRQELSLEHYQVYAYLKRLGFVLMRAEPPTPEYPAAPTISLPAARPGSITQGLMRLFSSFASKVISVAQLFHRSNWWRRLRLSQKKETQDIFQALRFIPCGHAVPLYRAAARCESSSKPPTPSPYKVFFHVYKPSTPFRKTAPPAPDFYIVVVDARTTSTPSLQELTALFGILPEMPLPLPRKRGLSTPSKGPADSQPNICPIVPETERETTSPAIISSSQPMGSWFSVLRTIHSHLLSFFRTVPSPQKTKSTFTPPRTNPFFALKTGKKTIVIAVVDASNISFFKFGQGAFEEWPIVL